MTATRRVAFVSFVVLLLNISASNAFGQEVFFSFVDDLLGEGAKRDPFEERIETDRHDFTQSTKTVGRGVVQIESGYTYFYKDNDGEIEKANTAPEMLLRYGLSDDIEVRLRYNYVWLTEENAETISGAEDLRLGLKLRVTEQSGWIPESAAELLITAPIGGNGLTTGRVDGGIDWIFGWRLNEKVELYGSTGLFSGSLGDFGLLPEDPKSDRFFVLTKSVAIGYEVSERSTLYGEFFGLFTQNHGEDPNPVVFNIGVDYFLSDNAIVDFRIGKGLNNDADDFFAGIGGGIRF